MWFELSLPPSGGSIFAEINCILLTNLVIMLNIIGIRARLGYFLPPLKGGLSHEAEAGLARC